MKTTHFGKRRAAAFLVSLAALLPTVASCGDKPANTPAETQPTKTAATEKVTEAVSLSPDEAAVADALSKYQDVDFEGYVLTILDRPLDSDWATVDVFSEGENGDPINDAVFRRNSKLEETMNIKIAEYRVERPASEAQLLVQAGDNSSEAVTDGLTALANQISIGSLYNLNNVSTLDLTHEWWDQQMNHDLSVAGDRFFCTGDISIMDNYGTWCILFNKTIAATYDMPDIYALVREGKWTIDVMYDLAKTATKDLDGNGTLESSDQWGLYTEGFNTYAFWAGTGAKIIDKDENDLPVLSVFTDRSASAMQKTVRFQTDKSSTFYFNIDTRDLFASGQGLFLFGGMWLITWFRGADVDFGIIPNPKFDEAQERYYITESDGNCTAYSILSNATDAERIGTILEAMGEVSRYTLTPAYYEISLKGKFLRDEESAEMLDIILANRAYDLGVFFNFGNLLTVIRNNKKEEFASIFAKRESAANKAIEQFVDSLDAIRD